MPVPVYSRDAVREYARICQATLRTVVPVAEYAMEHNQIAVLGTAPISAQVSPIAEDVVMHALVSSRHVVLDHAQICLATPPTAERVARL
ncbi:hypothetical protein N7488_002320 [Penicillium malachiteum]|nr:hypothetical protein N7488_002320 [Penicillium malachiteum]